MLESIITDRELVVDILKLLTMLLVTRILSLGSIFDKSWIISSIYLIIGISIYHLLTKKIIKNRFTNEIVRKVTKTWLKVGSMFLFAKILSGEDFDFKWISSTICIIIGFNFMDITFKFMPFHLILNNKIRNSIYDAIEIFCMSLISSFLIGKEINFEWFIVTLYTIIGYLFFEIFVSNIFN